MKSHNKIYQVEKLPVFQNLMFSSKEEARNCIKGDMDLVQDLETGLVFNQAFNSDLMNYNSNYQNEQAVSITFRKHLDHVSTIIQKYFQSYSLIEVGCGKAHFLEHLQGLGFKIVGIDPTYEGTNPLVIKEYFSTNTGISADGIILRHVLEHVQNPIEFLKQIRDSNGGSGRIYIEVPCFKWICDHCAWYDIFYEHVNYFQIHDFHQIFGTIYESGHLFGGQYMYVVADLSTIRQPKFYNKAELPEEFLNSINQYATQIESLGDKSVAVWGGASKGVIFCLLMQRLGIEIDSVIDINPAKQGKYLAGTGILVQSPVEGIKKLPQGANIFVMNSNYLGEIINLTDNRFNYLTLD